MKTKKLLKKIFKLLKKIDKNTERFEHSDPTPPISGIEPVDENDDVRPA